MATESAHASTTYWETSANDVEELFRWDSDRWEDHCVQLTGGPLGFWVRVAELPGLRVSWNRYGQSMQMRTRRFADGLAMIVVLESDKPTSFAGTLLETNDAILARNDFAVDYVLHPGLRSLTIEFEEWLVSLLRWRVSDALFHSLTKPNRKRLEDACLSMTDRIRKAQESDKPLSHNQVNALRAKVIKPFAVALQPWLLSDPPSGKETLGSKTQLEYSRIVRQAGLEMTKAGLGNPLPACELSRRVGVSERTLYRSFKEWVGMSPREYMRIHKLHCFRSRLLEENGGKGAISRAASDAGFDQFGRLAGIYKAHFGEEPRKTMNRKKSMRKAIAKLSEALKNK